MHGGLSPQLLSFDQLRKMPLPFTVPETGGGLVTDILWSDPCPEVKGKILFLEHLTFHDVTLAGFVPNVRGISFRFGADVVKEFVEKHNLGISSIDT